MKAVQEVIEKAAGYSWEGTCLAVGMKQGLTGGLKLGDDWEDVCLSYGFEYVDAEAKGRNEFGGERQTLVELARLMMAQSQLDWRDCESQLK